MPQTFDEVIADIFTIKNDTIPPTAWPKLTCGVANEVTLLDSSLKLGDQREIFFQNAGQFRAAADIRFLTGAPTATEKLRILPDGNVGIGTQTPAARLQVTGGAIMPATGNSNQAGIQFPSGATGDEAFIRYFTIAGETAKLQIGIGNDADDSINLVQAGAERLTIANGNVGIGTPNPQAKLHIAGVSPVLRIADGNQATGKILVSDASGNATWRDNSIFTVSGNLNIISGAATGTFAKLTDIMTFNKVAAASTIEIHMNTRAGSGTFSGANGVHFQVRVDNAPTTLANDGAITTSNTVEFLSVYAVFQSLAVGTHTVSVWIRTGVGTSSSVVLDPGGWGGRIIVKEAF
jgi:hypothetical protein